MIKRIALRAPCAAVIYAKQGIKASHTSREA